MASEGGYFPPISPESEVHTCLGSLGEVLRLSAKDRKGNLARKKAMIGENRLVGAIDHFSRYRAAFSLISFMEWSEGDAGSSECYNCLRNDLRFIQLADSYLGNETAFMSEIALFRCWFSLNVRLSLPHVDRTELAKPELFEYLSLLTGKTECEEFHGRAIEYGEKFGFVSYNALSRRYVFPLAHLFSYVSSRSESVINELYDEIRTVEERDVLLQKRLPDLLADALNLREEKIIKLRFGVGTDGRSHTLEKIAKRLNLTRERIRQIEKAALAKLSATSFLKIFLAEFVRKSGRLLVEANSYNTAYAKFSSLLLGIPYELLEGERILFLGSEGAIEPKQFLHCVTSDPSTLIKAVWGKFSFLPEEDLKNLEQTIKQQILRKAQHSDRIYHALRQIGQPAHFVDITDMHNELFPEKEMSYKSIHTVLSACSVSQDRKHGIVWVGMKGTYALEEWGYSRPEFDLFETVYMIVDRLYEKTGKPVSYNSIMAEIGKYRKIVNPKSVTMAAALNENLERLPNNFFIPSSEIDSFFGQSDYREDSVDSMNEEELDRLILSFREEQKTRKS